MAYILYVGLKMCNKQTLSIKNGAITFVNTYYMISKYKHTCAHINLPAKVRIKALVSCHWYSFLHRM